MSHTDIRAYNKAQAKLAQDRAKKICAELLVLKAAGCCRDPMAILRAECRLIEARAAARQFAEAA